VNARGESDARDPPAECERPVKSSHPCVSTFRAPDLRIG